MKAAGLGNADAEHRVGVAYATGKGVQKKTDQGTFSASLFLWFL
jgi:TPR repeat protein